MDSYEVKSLGFCTQCKHNIYEDKSFPEWMACYCKVPVIELKEVPKKEVYDEYYC